MAGKYAVTFFQNMSMSNLEGQYQHLWVAPSNLKSSILKEIDNQINLAKQQRKINGKGTTALILANVLPTIALVGGVLFFAFGGMYIFFK